jgi:hypothetical protein
MVSARDRFRLAYRTIAVRALANMNLALGQIDIGPAQASSDARIPVRAAVSNIVRPFPGLAALTIRRISSRVVMSRPTSSFGFILPCEVIATSDATFWATLPRRLASFKIAFSVMSTFLAVGRDML